MNKPLPFATKQVVAGKTEARKGPYQQTTYKIGKVDKEISKYATYWQVLVRVGKPIPSYMLDKHINLSQWENLGLVGYDTSPKKNGLHGLLLYFSTEGKIKTKNAAKAVAVKYLEWNNMTPMPKGQNVQYIQRGLSEKRGVEFVIWGVPKGKSDEVVLFAQDPRTKDPITDKKVANTLATIAKNKFGAKKVRIGSHDMSTPPDFRKGIKGFKESCISSDIEEFLSSGVTGGFVSAASPSPKLAKKTKKKRKVTEAGNKVRQTTGKEMWWHKLAAVNGPEKYKARLLKQAEANGHKPTGKEAIKDLRRMGAPMNRVKEDTVVATIAAMSEAELLEFSGSRLLSLFKDKLFGVISPEREWMNKAQKKIAMMRLRKALKTMHQPNGKPLGYIDTLGTYTYDSGETVKEKSLIVPLISKKQLLKLAVIFKQETVIFGAGKGKPRGYYANGKVADWSSRWKGITFNPAPSAQSQVGHMKFAFSESSKITDSIETFLETED